MKVIALVPMKGHSSRVPGKNLKDLRGKPLCYYILETLLKCKSIEKIVVNTDSSDIEKACKKLSKSIVIHERPKELCGDEVSMNKIIEYDISKLPSEHFLQTHSTSPLLTSETLDKALTQYLKGFPKHDSVFSVTKLQARLYNEKVKPINHDPNNLIPTQDLPPIFLENSAFYIFSKESFMKKKLRIGEKPFMFETPQIESIDIDTFQEFELVDRILAK